MFAGIWFALSWSSWFPGRELQPAIGAGQRSFETRMEKATGLDHDRNSGAAIRMAIGQPEEVPRFGLLGEAMQSQSSVLDGYTRDVVAF
jgi:hypothetical protein